MTHRVPTAIGGVTQIRDNKNTRRHHVSSPSQLPNSCGYHTFVIAGMGVFHVVVPHAEFVLQAATPRAFAIMFITLTIRLHETFLEMFMDIGVISTRV